MSNPPDPVRSSAIVLLQIRGINPQHMMVIATLRRKYCRSIFFCEGYGVSRASTGVKPDSGNGCVS